MNNDKRIIARVARTFKTLLLGAMVAMTCSCEDFLTISPTDKIVLEDFWKSKADVENVVAESYRLMTQFDVLSRVIVWGELRGDNVVEGNYGGNNDIKNIIKANKRQKNEDVLVSYNITSKIALAQMDSKNKIPKLGLIKIIEGALTALEDIEEYQLVKAKIQFNEEKEPEQHIEPKYEMGF